jgi:drug/metabolite transporter (DMT)-like permease
MVGLVSEGINTIFVRRRMMDMEPMAVTGIRLFVAALIVAVLALVVGDFSFADVTPAGYFSLGYAALVGALAGQFTAFYLQRRYGATAFSLTAYFIPVVATTFGVLLLNEIVTWAMVFGVLLIAGGVFLINRRHYVEEPLPATYD